MTDRTSEAPRLPVPLRRCHGALQAINSNGTCVEQVGFFPPFSSTLALLVLVAVLAGVVLVSLATFHFHKRKLRKRKIQRAQEEYERDSRSPTRAGASGDPARPCVIVRPVRCAEVEPACRSGGGGEVQPACRSGGGGEVEPACRSGGGGEVQPECRSEAAGDVTGAPGEDELALHETVALDC